MSDNFNKELTPLSINNENSTLPTSKKIRIKVKKKTLPTSNIVQSTPPSLSINDDNSTLPISNNVGLNYPEQIKVNIVQSTPLSLNVFSEVYKRIISPDSTSSDSTSSDKDIIDIICQESQSASLNTFCDDEELPTSELNNMSSELNNLSLNNDDENKCDDEDKLDDVNEDKVDDVNEDKVDDVNEDKVDDVKLYQSSNAVQCIHCYKLCKTEEELNEHFLTCNKIYEKRIGYLKLASIAIAFVILK
jgi:hypothetical protein